MRWLETWKPHLHLPASSENPNKHQRFLFCFLSACVCVCVCVLFLFLLFSFFFFPRVFFLGGLNCKPKGQLPILRGLPKAPSLREEGILRGDKGPKYARGPVGVLVDRVSPALSFSRWPWSCFQVRGPTRMRSRCDKTNRSSALQFTPRLSMFFVPNPKTRRFWGVGPPPLSLVGADP